MAQTSRRELLRRAAQGALGLLIGACLDRASARGTGKSSPRYRALASAEAEVLAHCADILVPGARAAGVARYVDDQLRVEPARSMLMLRYLRIDPPFLPFYRAGIRALERSAQARYAKAFVRLTAADATALVTDMATGHLEGWSGPPAPLWYFVLRSDAVDVVYGTEAGFARLGVPYMAHITPPSPWGSV